MPSAPRWIDPVLALVLVLGALVAWPVAEGATPLADGPSWATTQDLVLDGPDAGRWAEQALAFVAGASERLDPHRSPTWTLLTAIATPFSDGSVVLAGHLVNHLLYVAIGALAYALARTLALGPLAAAAAGVSLLVHPEIRYNAVTFCVDGTVHTTWIAALASAAWVRGSVPRAVLAGVASALAFTAHVTTLVVPVPALLLVALTSPAGRRRTAVGAYVASLAVVAGGIFQLLPPMELSNLTDAVFIGVVDKEHTSGAGDALARIASVLERARVDMLPGLFRWLSGQIFVYPPLLALALAGLGTAGVGLVPRGERLTRLAELVPRPARVATDWALRGLSLGLPVALPLTSIPVFFAVSASPRYAGLLYPLLLVLLVRGAASVGAAFDGLVAARLPKWPGVAQAGLALLFAAPLVREAPVSPRGDPAMMVAQRKAADVILERWGAGTQSSTWQKEVSAYTGALSCPSAFCPRREDEADLRDCLAMMRAECEGSGDTIPYVVTKPKPVDDRFPIARAMDDWVLAQWPPVEEIETPGLTISIVAIPRASDR